MLGKVRGVSTAQGNYFCPVLPGCPSPRDNIKTGWKKRNLRKKSAEKGRGNKRRPQSAWLVRDIQLVAGELPQYHIKCIVQRKRDKCTTFPVTQKHGLGEYEKLLHWERKRKITNLEMDK